MEFKAIDNKNKEMYINNIEETDNQNYENDFWLTINNMAMLNKVYQNLIIA